MGVEEAPRQGRSAARALRVGLFVTCLVDLMRPRIGFAALRLLRSAGCEVVVPSTQTCCGQPAFNSGDARLARALALKVVGEFEGLDYVVAPSGSCAGMIRIHYPELFRDDAANRERVAALAARTFELTDFLVGVCALERVPGDFAGIVTYHDSCSGLRELGVKHQPRKLLQTMPGIVVREMNGCEECCGFGGLFSVKFAGISGEIAARKCANIRASGADAVVLGDLGCMLNIEGRLRRLGDEHTRVLHVAEVLAGEEH
ncbi:MAG TPA: (Fe-S)-binding protein [Rhodocyclaceae bacterium]|nr:(Fe-S)-binding protein [Rhodocyclaceae bacterium]